MSEPTNVEDQPEHQWVFAGRRAAGFTLIELLVVWDTGYGNVPAGGNFLFEDGHVAWYRFEVSNARGTVDVGCAESNWVLFYKVPNVNTN